MLVATRANSQKCHMQVQSQPFEVEWYIVFQSKITS